MGERAPGERPRHRRAVGDPVGAVRPRMIVRRLGAYTLETGEVVRVQRDRSGPMVTVDITLDDGAHRTLRVHRDIDVAVHTDAAWSAGDLQ